MLKIGTQVQYRQVKGQWLSVWVSMELAERHLPQTPPGRSAVCRASCDSWWLLSSLVEKGRLTIWAHWNLCDKFKNVSVNKQSAQVRSVSQAQRQHLHIFAFLPHAGKRSKRGFPLLFDLWPVERSFWNLFPLSAKTMLLTASSPSCQEHFPKPSMPQTAFLQDVWLGQPVTPPDL